MADIADIAQEQIDAMAGSLIANSKKPEGPAHTGFCANCDTPLAPGLRFCDADCREDWERAATLKARNGRGAEE